MKKRLFRNLLMLGLLLIALTVMVSAVRYEAEVNGKKCLFSLRFPTTAMNVEHILI